MKSLCQILIFAFIVTNVSASDYHREINLKGKWYFKVGDNKTYAKPNYDDGDWGSLGISAATRGIVRPGVAARDYLNPVAPLVIPIGTIGDGTGYVFHDDTDAYCCSPF